MAKKIFTYGPLATFVAVFIAVFVGFLIVFGSSEQLQGKFTSSQVVFTVNSIYEDWVIPDFLVSEGTSVFEAEFTCTTASTGPCVLEGLEFEAIIEENFEEDFWEPFASASLLDANGNVIATDGKFEKNKVTFTGFTYSVEPKLTAVLRVVVKLRAKDDAAGISSVLITLPKEKVEVIHLVAQPVVVLKEKDKKRRAIRARTVVKPGSN